MTVTVLSGSPLMVRLTLPVGAVFTLAAVPETSTVMLVHPPGAMDAGDAVTTVVLCVEPVPVPPEPATVTVTEAEVEAAKVESPEYCATTRFGSPVELEANRLPDAVKVAVAVPAVVPLLSVPMPRAAELVWS